MHNFCSLPTTCNCCTFATSLQHREAFTSTAVEDHTHAKTPTLEAESCINAKNVELWGVTEINERSTAASKAMRSSCRILLRNVTDESKSCFGNYESRKSIRRRSPVLSSLRLIYCSGSTAWGMKTALHMTTVMRLPLPWPWRTLKLSCGRWQTRTFIGWEATLGLAFHLVERWASWYLHRCHYCALLTRNLKNTVRRQTYLNS
jgi:hypothetical protein